MKHLFSLSAFFFLCSFLLKAQQNTVAAGGLATGSGGTASYSLGQIDYITGTGTGGSASQGVQQVYRLNLHLKYYLQGYYESTGLMKPVLFNEGVEFNPASTNVDTVTVELHHPTTPYSLAHSFKGILQTNGVMACSFPNANAGSSYFVVLRHRNTIETWSATAITLSDAVYDFSTSASQAYGANQIAVGNNIFALYSGDMNQDDNIDLDDYAILEAGINNFSFGYEVGDISGDGNVDLGDAPLVELNINNFVFSAQPN